MNKLKLLQKIMAMKYRDIRSKVYDIKQKNI